MWPQGSSPGTLQRSCSAPPHYKGGGGAGGIGLLTCGAPRWSVTGPGPPATHKQSAKHRRRCRPDRPRRWTTQCPPPPLRVYVLEGGGAGGGGGECRPTKAGPDGPNYGSSHGGHFGLGCRGGKRPPGFVSRSNTSLSSPPSPPDGDVRACVGDVWCRVGDSQPGGRGGGGQGGSNPNCEKLPETCGKVQEMAGKWREQLRRNCGGVTKPAGASKDSTSMQAARNVSASLQTWATGHPTDSCHGDMLQYFAPVPPRSAPRFLFEERDAAAPSDGC